MVEPQRNCFVVAAYLAVILSFCSYRTNADSVEEDDGDQYFGVPLGALHFSSDGTSAEIYAADEFTIIFNHFYHNPRRPGCTAMMIGPARKEDKENVVEGHGLLIAPAHPPVAARHRFRVRRDVSVAAAPMSRARRQLAEQFSGWPVEFDHLLMASNANAESKSDVPQQDSAVEESVKAQPHKVTFVESSTQKDGSEAATKSSLKPTVVTPPRVPPTVENSATTSPAATTTTTSSTVISSSITASQSSASSDVVTTMASKPTAAASQTSTEMAETTAPTTTPTTTPTTSEATATFPEDFDATTLSANELEEPTIQEPMPIIFFESKGTGKAKQVKLKSTSDLGVRVTSSGETLSFVRNDDVSTGDDDFVRRAPSRIELTDHSKNGLPNSQPAPANVRTTTPLYYVIKDPREARRQRLLALKRRIGLPLATTTTTVSPASDELTRDFDARFELPSIRDKLATFSLANGAKINQYKWIGLYDQCLKRHIPLVSLRDVDPPREEKISPISGWSHNITSYRVHILNCNTVLIPGFTFNPGNASANTYFFVGIGDFPNNIERQMRATVVGSRRDEPLHAYNGEDVLLRLPNGFRTFDIDFITVYNTDEQKSYAHVIVPSLLVPPCAEE